MRHSILLFILLLNSFFMFSQDSVVVIVQVTDMKYDDAIQNVTATIVSRNESAYYTTNSKGLLYFKAQKGSIVNFKFSHHTFLAIDSEKKITSKSSIDTVKYSFKMEFIRSQDVIGTIVTAPGLPVAVYHSKQLHVSDFEIQKNGNILLLTYPKRLKKGSSLLNYDGINVLNSFQVPGLAEELIRDYRGNTHVVCSENVYGIHLENEGVEISTLPKEYYIKYLAPIIDTSHTKLYFSNFSSDYPAFEYFSYDQLDSTYKKIMDIEDELMMELYRSEYKWVDVRTKLWAKNKEIQTGVDAEIWVGANFFTQSIYYKELYAPLFHRNDSLFVFDYYKDKMFTYSSEGEPIDSVGVYHHYNPKSTGWKKQLIQDQVTGQIYAVFDRSGFSYIGLVDTQTGQISEQVKLEFRYVDKIAIHNNFVYYIYRPFESIQKKYLYKERLPYQFEAAIVPQGD